MEDFKNSMVHAKVLRLTLKKRWFDMIKSGVKKEEYREIKKYWIRRFLTDHLIINRYWRMGESEEETVKMILEDLEYYNRTKMRSFDLVEFKNGYSKDAPTLYVECKGIKIGRAMNEWSNGNMDYVFVISLGDIVYL